MCKMVKKDPNVPGSNNVMEGGGGLYSTLCGQDTIQFGLKPLFSKIISLFKLLLKTSQELRMLSPVTLY